MYEGFIVLLLLYMMSLGFGLVVKGPRGMQIVHRLWFRAMFGILGWLIDQLGNGLKAFARKLRR